MTWVAVVSAVLLAWVVLSVAVAVLVGQAIRIANRHAPRRRIAARSGRLERFVEIATGAIPIIRPRAD